MKGCLIFLALILATGCNRSAIEVNRGTSSVAIVMTAANELVQWNTNIYRDENVLALPEGTQPSDVAVNPDGNLIYIVDRSNSRVLVYDILNLSRTPVKLLTGNNPQGIAVGRKDPFGFYRLYVANTDDDSISVFSVHAQNKTHENIGNVPLRLNNQPQPTSGILPFKISVLFDQPL